MSTYALVVSTAPSDNKTVTALNLAETIITNGHQLHGVFFYQDGVLNANNLLQTPSDEQNLYQQWQRFQQASNTPLFVCISAAERRGLSDGSDSELTNNVGNAFTVSGLGELAVISSKADKVIQL
ncbi:sulfurtransferase complex subunit TusD [Thalassotalea ponticola]|uniref:sulfurtransferase complex subunit TusD n=1 Tax=Thalassotalea ponticola TaxID=1523392 RepID=UPI0025B4F2E8|nr:sulfurtransferase complex subunit TusD [Thalassotalea ponticola]MDN3651462.1 sulfurtransferase complex subunit TusD [Thalassotalea ponticola]